MGGGPHATWDNEELTLTITGLGGGWTLGQLGSIKLFDHAQVQWPHDWDHFKIGATTRILEWTWQANGWLVLDTTISSGIDWSRKDGMGGSMQVDEQLKAHLLHRPTVSLDLTLDFKLDGTADHSGFKGSGSANAGLVLHF
jgi:hypothetical protein